MKFSLYGIAIVGLIGVLGGLIGQTANDVLFVISWSYFLYKVAKTIWILGWKLPKGERYFIPDEEILNIPETITRSHLPSWVKRPRSRRPMSGEEIPLDVAELIDGIIIKIGKAANASEVREHVHDSLAISRKKIQAKYSDINRELAIVGYEGMIGTLISLVTFMVQARVLFIIPSTDDPAQLIKKMSENLSAIDLITIASGFVSSIIGWMVKTYIGGEVDYRKDLEAKDIIALESWINDKILRQLSLESLSTIVTPAALSEASVKLREVSKKLNRLLEVVVNLDDVCLDAKFVAGGISYKLRREEDVIQGLVSLDQDGGRNGRE